MNLCDYKAIKASARETLEQAGESPKKLVLLYAGATSGVFLITFLLNCLLNWQIESTTGLGGMQMRSILSSIQVVLRYVSVFFMLFWQMGFLHVVLRYAKGQSAEPQSLLEGFRHGGSVLGITVVQSLILMAVTMVLSYVSVFIYVLTPMSEPLYALLNDLMAPGGAEIQLDGATMASMMRMLWPALLIFGILFLLVAVPLIYRFRMSRYCLMDEPRARTFGAVRFSVVAMKKNRMKLLKLDLSFWWYYVLQVLVLSVSTCDLWLPKLGISLPMSAGWAYVLSYVLYLVLQFGLTVWAENYVQSSYARFYLTLKEEKLREQTQMIVQTRSWENPQT